MRGTAGTPAEIAATFDLDMRRRIDSDLVVMTKAFMRQKVEERTRFFAYVPLTQLHFPTLPHRDFEGKTGHGDFADSMSEMDHRVGEILDEIDALSIAQDTLVIFASDNGPEYRREWRGTAGPWVGTYHTAMEGGLRAPCIFRWPGRLRPGRVSNEIVHVTDLYTTLAAISGAELPADRPIDGIDQSPFIFGQQERSEREGFVFYIRDEMRAVKWKNWKLHFAWEAEVNAGVKHLEWPMLFNLVTDPKEETDVDTQNAWARMHMVKLANEFKASLARFPPIPPGAPDGFIPEYNL
jgi:arylsulfatase